MKVGRIHYEPGYKLEDARVALQKAEKSRNYEREWSKSYKEELLRTRRKLKELDPENAPHDEFDGGAWFTYLTGDLYVDVTSFSTKVVAVPFIPGLRP